MDDWKPTPRETVKGIRWIIGIGLASFILVLLLASMSIFGWGFFQRATADFRGETKALEQIKANPNSRISAYEHFFNLCASIQGHEDAIRALQAELDGNPQEDRREQIQGAITANQTQRDRKIRQYNSDASKDFTTGQFRDADLPNELDINAKETTCSASES